METGSRYDVIFDFKTVDSGQPGDHEEHRRRRALRRRSSPDDPAARSSARPTASWPSTWCCRSTPRCRTSRPTGINFGPVVPRTDTACARWRCSRAWTSSGGCSRCWAPPSRPPTTPAIRSTGRTRRDYVNARPRRPDGGLDRLAQPDDREPGPRHHRGVGDLERHRRRPPGAPAPGALRDPGPPGDHFDSNTTDDDRCSSRTGATTPANDGTYLVNQPMVQHNGLLGTGSGS